ncbi:hypothetical protein J0910_29835 [Nocardiopsis sp. CNT-189]|uniref:hypothetical protein n=1 Tax=Nocardiopsis oceanisediminis TaxID=2816862 RepID=UPI003B2D646A
MKRITVPAAAALVLFSAGCSGAASDPEQPTPEEAPVAEEAAGEEEAGPATVGLDGPHDFGDGFTVEITDLRREVDPDGFNSSTGEEGELPYAAWKFEITNTSGAPLHTGSTTSACFVGDPLEESEQPVLGESVNPPDTLADGQSATWDADCWMGEEESQLQYTLEFWDEEGAEPTYTVTFAGEVPQ